MNEVVNATKDDAAKVVTRLKGLKIVDPVATPGFTVEQNKEAGLVGITSNVKTTD